MREARDGVRRAIELYKQLAQVEAMADGLEDDAQPTASHPTSDVSANDVETFAKEAERRLSAWNFPGLGRVTFSESDWDIVISGRRRSSHGKGVRAVTHAAFTTALLAYCERRHLPHPGFLVIDSPLVVYREPDASDPAFSADVKGAFFRDLAAAFATSQVLVLENEEPPDDLTASRAAACIHFTGTNAGRSGFIPPRRTSAQG